MANIEIQGMEQLLAKLKELQGMAGDDIFDGIANQLEDTAKNLAPVQTGNLRNSINVLVEGTEINRVLTLGASANYATEVELGTSNRVPKPFLQPAITQNQEKVIDTVTNYLDDKIKEVVK